MYQLTAKTSEAPRRNFETDVPRTELVQGRKPVSNRLWAGMAAAAVVSAVGVGALAGPVRTAEVPAPAEVSTTAAAPLVRVTRPLVALPLDEPYVGPLEPGTGEDATAQAALAAAPVEAPPAPAPEPAPAPAGDAMSGPAVAAPAPESAPVQAVAAAAPAPAPAQAAPAVRTIYVAGAGGQAMVDACIGPIHFTPNDGYSLFITEHDFCGGWARFSGIAVGETISIPGYGTYTATARGQVPNPGTTNDVIAVFGGFPRAILQTCIPGTNQMLLIALN